MQSRDPDVWRVYRNPKSCLINELWLLWTFCKHFYQFWLQEIFSNVYFISLHPPGELSMLLFSANYNNTSASSVAICHNSLLWSVENRLQNIKFHRIETFFLDQKVQNAQKNPNLQEACFGIGSYKSVGSASTQHTCGCLPCSQITAERTRKMHVWLLKSK